MNVLSIFGGHRKKGNTITILGWVEERLRDLGHEIERINLSTKKVTGCVGCFKCKDNMDEPGCVLKDDGAFIINRMIANDVVLYSSPLYYWGFTALMKAFIDRCHCLYRGECGSPEHTSFVEGQRKALIVTAADPFENNAEQILTVFQRSLIYEKAHSAGEFLVCNCTTPDELDGEIKAQAIRFANQLLTEIKTPYSLLFPGRVPNMVPKVG
jgi:multimeric flavodoxin WrbA